MRVRVPPGAPIEITTGKDAGTIFVFKGDIVMTTKTEMGRIAERLKPIIAKYEINVVYNAKDRKR